MKIGAWLLVLFLVPVTALAHNFWSVEGPAASAAKIEFLKNCGIVGGALMIAYFGAGPISIDAKMEGRNGQAPRS